MTQIFQVYAPGKGEAEADRLIQLGNQEEDNGVLDVALAHYQMAVTVCPVFPKAYLNLGNGLKSLGRHAEAIAAYRTALELDSAYAGAHFNLGCLLHKLREHEAAATELHEVMRIRPDMADAAVVLADVFESLGRLREAEEMLLHAMNTDPRLVGAVQNLGVLLTKQARFDEAETMFQRALSMDPDSAEASVGLGSLYLKLGRASEAEPLFRRALAMRAASVQAGGNLLFSLNLRDDLDSPAVFREHLLFGQALERELGQSQAAVSYVNTRAADRAIRLGYVSGDLVQHAVGLFLRPVLESHDKNQFDVYCYSNNDTNDDLTADLRSKVSTWRDVASLDDRSLIERVRSDEIDILVDLSGHTARSRIAVFAAKPAPIAVTWLGYLNTTGLRSIDYRICDRYTDPVGVTEQFHTEQLIRMPHSQWCYVPVYQVPVSNQPHLNEPDKIVFGSFNQFAKISDSCLSLWSAVLARVPTAHLRFLDVPVGTARENFIVRLKRAGIDPSRVTLFGRLAILDYFSAISDVDIALDSYPYNGATTTLDTLWMGVPLVALVGERAISRGSYSILSTLDMPDLIARTDVEFVARNVALTENPARRDALRHSLRHRMQTSPLMDARSFTAALEGHYREMWRVWCRAS